MQKQSYVKLDESTDFRKLAKIMSEDYGYKMNHATARNNYMKAIRLFLGGVLTELKLPANNDTTLNDLLSNQEVHDAVYDILFKTYGIATHNQSNN